jgi:hypothetical protein
LATISPQDTASSTVNQPERTPGGRAVSETIVVTQVSVWDRSFQQ